MMEGMRRRAAEEAPAAPAVGGGGGARERCPRCLSKDTKFCYYNNYNTTQPRHFCKSCRRYWTLGGTLRNVPIGGSSRKRLRRTSPSAAAASSSSVASVKPLRSLPSLTNQADLGFGQLLSSSGFMALGEPLMHGRTGFELGLGLGLGSGTGASASMEEMGFGTSFLWPSSLLEDEIGGGNTWRIGSGGEGCFGGTDWKDVAVSAPHGGGGGGGGGGADHGLN